MWQLSPRAQQGGCRLRPGGGTDVRVAMIGYTVYELDARVKRAADALVESGHHVDLFVTDHAGSRASNSELLTIHRLQMKKRRSAAMRYAYEYGFFGAWAFV